jgi:hypothetical protein
MTSFAHKVIEMLKNGPRRVPKSEKIEDKIAALILAIENAEKYDFGVMHLERVGEDYAVPELHRDEWDFWNEGLIPPPAPIAWMEMRIGGYASGLLILCVPGEARWNVTRVDLVNDEVLWLDCWAYCDHGTSDSPYHLITATFDDELKAFVKAERAKNSPFASVSEEKLLIAQIRADAAMAIYLCLMLTSKSTEINFEPAPVRLNIVRAKHGKLPLFEHKVVRIIPNAYVRAQTGAALPGGRHHASPRLHWRRSHVRSSKHGKRVVVARCLVGRKELGEISHEYKVGP